VDTEPLDAAIKKLYQERLGRAASQLEADQWKAAAQVPGGAAVISNAIERSAESRTALVKTWYERFLGRPAQSGEEQGWVALLLRGATEEQVLSGILGSVEFASRANTLFTTGSANERLVRALYSLLLNRSASSAEVSGWVNLLPRVGGSGVALGFLTSQEFRTDTVSGFYTALLNRDADLAGLLGWVNSNVDLTSIRAAIEGSPEFING
jgi:hypothetical protein